jgi:hypothetical protein
MEQMNLRFVELHTPLFVGGTNLGAKLDSRKRTGLRLVRDFKNQELIVIWNQELSQIPWNSNVANSIAFKKDQEKILETLIPAEINVLPYAAQQSHPMTAGIGSAQVETPFGHVHAGPGKGKTR